jgi:hypothetical protein
MPSLELASRFSGVFFFCVSEAWAMKQVALCSRPMPTHSRRRRPPATRRRALELLASCPAGCSEAVLAAHGFEVKQVVALVRAGLATARIARMVAGGRSMEVTLVRITDAGRRLL